MASRFRFSAESLVALGLGLARIQSAGADLARLLDFPAEVKVTSVATDGDAAVLTLTGAKLADGSPAPDYVTGSYSVSSSGRRHFEGFRPADGAAPAPVPAPATAAPTAEG